MIIAAVLILAIACVGYWLRQAHLQAKRDRHNLECPPSIPTAQDAFYIASKLRDARIEAEWRKAVKANEARRKRDRIECGEFLHHRSTSMVSRRQAD